MQKSENRSDRKGEAGEKGLYVQVCIQKEGGGDRKEAKAGGKETRE